MDQDILQKLIKKYLNGKCTPQEINTIKEWYDSFDEEQDIIETLSAEEVQQLKHRLFTRIRNNIASTEVSSRATNRTLQIPKRVAHLLTGIAAMVLLVTGIFLFRNNYNTQFAPSLARDIVAFNRTKSIKKLTLEDGSVVWLNPNSKITYPKKFPLTNREIKMNGEAFFEVKPDAKRPFIIYSDNIVTRVWGTSFLVRANESDPVEVSVITGKVSVRLQQQHEDAEVMLLPDQKITFLKTANLLKKEKEQKISPIRIWRKTTLSFDNTPLKEVIQTLNKKFEVNISTIDETLLNYALKADFTDQSLPSILEMLEKSLDLKYEISDRKIFLITNHKNLTNL